LNRRDIQGWVVACWIVLIVLLPLVACGRPVEPTPTPSPTPDEVQRYIMATERYTSYGAIVHANELSARGVAGVIRALQAISPPATVDDLHAQALEAYRQIYEGKVLLPGADSELRAEAYFMIEWGTGLLLDYREKLEKLRF